MDKRTGGPVVVSKLYSVRREFRLVFMQDRKGFRRQVSWLVSRRSGSSGDVEHYRIAKTHIAL